MDEITVTGGFWREYQSLNAESIIGHCLEWMERVGWIRNFDLAAAGTLGSDHAGIEFVDSEVYKLLEAMAWELGRSADEALAATYSSLVARVAAAQESDGYLHTSFGHPGQRERFSDLEWGHELYCFGHLLQAAVARLRTGHDDDLPAVARRVADMLYREFGPGGRTAVCGHPEIEPALAEFARATGDKRYFELARLFVERRGTGTLAPIEYGPEYFQDDVPVRDAEVLRGHAVRALYLAAGALDVAVDTDDVALKNAVARQWENTVARRTYITGGIGSHHRDESFGADFELPPDRAYSETCAGIASIMLSWRLLLATGEARYADHIERTLLNNVLASPRADGRAFFYTNTLHQRTAGVPPHPTDVSKRADSSMRAPWFEVSCCPTNVARTLANIPLYFATADDAGVQLHHYGDYRVDTRVGGERVALTVATDYPFDGEIAVTIHAAPLAGLRLSLRIPAWAREGATWRCADPTVTFELLEGHVAVSGACAAGTVIRLDLPVQPRLTFPDPRIDAIRGEVAVERGPLVLALESVDLPQGVTLDQVRLDTSAPLEGTAAGATAHLSVVAHGAGGEWPYGGAHTVASEALGPVSLIPYYRWANRGPSTMRVFTPIADSNSETA
ncbi:beta-L-arabinofuranosidase domain-containing protein [Demequina sp.]|uniref:glycoside hydrolase family 127 protein n=1 Tax=Demequina sp. TaxID=2050685 RepID=UPI0025C57270|nr:beta-L-arabinofuranosidase domain-containing protein [Demequina sp.]